MFGLFRSPEKDADRLFNLSLQVHKQLHDDFSQVNPLIGMGQMRLAAFSLAMTTAVCASKYAKTIDYANTVGSLSINKLTQFFENAMRDGDGTDVDLQDLSDVLSKFVQRYLEFFDDYFFSLERQDPESMTKCIATVAEVIGIEPTEENQLALLDATDSFPGIITGLRSSW